MINFRILNTSILSYTFVLHHQFLFFCRILFRFKLQIWNSNYDSTKQAIIISIWYFNYNFFWLLYCKIFLVPPTGIFTRQVNTLIKWSSFNSFWDWATSAIAVIISWVFKSSNRTYGSEIGWSGIDGCSIMILTRSFFF